MPTKNETAQGSPDFRNPPPEHPELRRLLVAIHYQLQKLQDPSRIRKASPEELNALEQTAAQSICLIYQMETNFLPTLRQARGDGWGDGYCRGWNEGQHSLRQDILGYHYIPGPNVIPEPEPPEPGYIGHPDYIQRPLWECTNPAEREAIALRLEGKTFTEIATATGLSSDGTLQRLFVRYGLIPSPELEVNEAKPVPATDPAAGEEQEEPTSYSAAAGPADSSTITPS